MKTVKIINNKEDDQVYLTDVIVLICPVSTLAVLLVSKSHTTTLPSLWPMARSVPFLLKLQVVAQPSSRTSSIASGKSFPNGSFDVW